MTIARTHRARRALAVALSLVMGGIALPAAAAVDAQEQAAFLDVGALDSLPPRVFTALMPWAHPADPEVFSPLADLRLGAGLQVSVPAAGEPGYPTHGTIEVLNPAADPRQQQWTYQPHSVSPDLNDHVDLTITDPQTDQSVTVTRVLQTYDHSPRALPDHVSYRPADVLEGPVSAYPLLNDAAAHRGLGLLNAPFHIDIVTGPEHGTAQVVAEPIPVGEEFAAATDRQRWRIDYTPDAAGREGHDEVTYRVTDADGDAAEATVTWHAIGDQGHETVFETGYAHLSAQAKDPGYWDGAEAEVAVRLRSGQHAVSAPRSATETLEVLEVTGGPTPTLLADGASWHLSAPAADLEHNPLAGTWTVRYRRHDPTDPNLSEVAGTLHIDVGDHHDPGSDPTSFWGPASTTTDLEVPLSGHGTFDPCSARAREVVSQQGTRTLATLPREYCWDAAVATSPVFGTLESSGGVFTYHAPAEPVRDVVWLEYTLPGPRVGVWGKSAAVHVNVVDPTAPYAEDDFLELPQGRAGSVDVTANDHVPVGSRVVLGAWNSDELGTDANVTVNDGVLTVRAPSLAWPGTARVAYEVHSPPGHDEPWVVHASVVVAAAAPGTFVNRPPVTVADAVTATGSTPVVVDVLANDHDPDDDLLFLAPPLTAQLDGISLACSTFGSCTLRATSAQAPPVQTWQYTARDQFGASSVGELRVSFQQPAKVAPTSPRDVRATRVPGGIRLVWKPPAAAGTAPVDSYLVSLGSTTRAVGPGVRSALVKHPRLGTRQTYRVRARSAHGESAAVTGARVVIGLPAAPTSLRAQRATRVVSWSAAPGTKARPRTGFDVYVGSWRVARTGPRVRRVVLPAAVARSRQVVRVRARGPVGLSPVTVRSSTRWQ